MAEATDDMEMKERSEQEAGEQEGEEETNVDDERRRLHERMSNKDRPFTRVNTDTRTSGRSEGSVPDTKHDVGAMKRSMTNDKKKFIREWLDVSLNKGDGPNSTKLFDNLVLTREESKNINVIMFRGRRIAETINGKVEYSTKGEVKPYVDEFRDLLKRADAEHQRTPAALGERRVGVDLPQEAVRSIINNVAERLERKIDNKFSEIRDSTDITETELREIRGVVYAIKNTDLTIVGDAKIAGLKVDRDNWKELAVKSRTDGKEGRALLFEAVADLADMRIAEVELELNRIPENEEVRTMIEDEAEVNDLTKFEKFKKWARENLLGLSSVAISVAGVLTTVIMAGRNALKKGGDALGKFGKAVANLAKKFGPVLSALGTLITNVIMFLANGLLFLAQNLWILVLAITYFIYNEYMRTAKRD